MNYLAQVDDDSAEIAGLTRERERRDPAGERQTPECDALDARIAALTARRDALSASISALEDLDRDITAAAAHRAAARKSFRSVTTETLRLDWPAPVLLAAATTALLCGMEIFPPTWNGDLAAGGTAGIAVHALSCVQRFLRAGLDARRARREHTELIARHGRMMAGIEEGRPVQSVIW